MNLRVKMLRIQDKYISKIKDPERIDDKLTDSANIFTFRLKGKVAYNILQGKRKVLLQ